MRSAAGPTSPTFVQEARRAQIVDCAIQALAEDGYAAASMANIGRRANIAKSAIAHHFGNKDHLVDEVAKAVFETARADLTPRLASADTTRERLRRYIEGRVLFLETHRAHMLALFEIWTNVRGDDGALRFGEEDASSTVDAIVEMLRDGQRSGEFGDFDVDVMAMAIRQAIDGVLLGVRAQPDLDLHRYARELVKLFDDATRPTHDPSTGEDQ